MLAIKLRASASTLWWVHGQRQVVRVSSLCAIRSDVCTLVTGHTSLSIFTLCTFDLNTFGQGGRWTSELKRILSRETESISSTKTDQSMDSASMSDSKWSLSTPNSQIPINSIQRQFSFAEIVRIKAPNSWSPSSFEWKRRSLVHASSMSIFIKMINRHDDDDNSSHRRTHTRNHCRPWIESTLFMLLLLLFLQSHTSRQKVIVLSSLVCCVACGCPCFFGALYCFTLMSFRIAWFVNSQSNCARDECVCFCVYSSRRLLAVRSAALSNSSSEKLAHKNDHTNINRIQSFIPYHGRARSSMFERSMLNSSHVSVTQ